MHNINEQPWAIGPHEILNHVISIMNEDSDANRRIAMILTDNAIEQMIKTYLGLPKRISGLSIPRKRLDEISESFPLLLNMLEEYSSGKLEGIDLGVIEWYHRLRNQLYHGGLGLTVEKQHIEVYIELANILFKNLFGVYLLEDQNGDRDNIFERFIELWKRLENALDNLVTNWIPKEKGVSSLEETLLELTERYIMPDNDRQQIVKLQQLRMKVIHGEVDYQTAITWQVVENLQRYVIKYEDIDHLAFG